MRGSVALALVFGNDFDDDAGFSQRVANLVSERQVVNPLVRRSVIADSPAFGKTKTPPFAERGFWFTDRRFTQR